MKTLRTLVCMLALAVASTSGAQTLSLTDIKSVIRTANPGLRMYDADIRAMDEAAKGAKSWMAPEISTGFWMTPYNPKMWKPESDAMTGATSEGMGQYMIGVQQMLPKRSRLNAEYAYMSAMSSVEKERKGQAAADLFFSAGKAYYTWLIDKKKLQVLNENERVLQFMIKNAELRYRNGLEKISAYYKAKAAIGKLENMRLMLESEIVQQRISLNALMYRDKNATLNIDSSYVLRNYDKLISDTSLVGARSDVQAISQNISLTRLQQTSERAKLRPEFGLRYEHMIGLGGQPAQYTLMGMMRLPFVSWAARMNKANIESLRWKEEALSQERQMLINEASGMAQQMHTELKQRQKQVTLYEDNIIPALRRNYQTMQLGYEQNTEELFMLYDAWESLNMTQLDYLDQLQQLLLTQVALDRILEIR